MKVPLTQMYVDDEIRQVVLRVLDSGWFVKNKENAGFEAEFAAFVGAKQAIACSSGTAALQIALQALDVQRGDEVLVPSFSFIATVTPLLNLGAKPIFVDIDPQTYNIDPKLARLKVTKRTKGIIPVHLYGHPADLGALKDLAEERSLWMLEDACQAHGARYNGRHVGTFGNIAAFSFYPSKNMTVCGDGGAVVTNQSELAERARMFVDAGRGPGDKYIHRVVAGNYRLSEVHAAVGRVQLRHLADWVAQRRRVAAAYTRALAGIKGAQPPVELQGCAHSYYVYTVRVKRRDRLAEHLSLRGIATGLYYPTPIHRQPCLSAAYHRVRLPETDRAANEVLSLPIYPRLATETARDVAGAVAEFYAGT